MPVIGRSGQPLAQFDRSSSLAYLSDGLSRMPDCFTDAYKGPAAVEVGERTCPRLRRSTRGDVHDSLGEGLWRLLRHVVPDASGDGPVLVWPGEFLRVRRGLWVRRTVGVAFHRNRRDADDRALGEPLFEVVVFRLALDQAQSPTVVVNHDRDMIGV